MKEPDLEVIPEQLDVVGKPVVFFDLETTGLGNTYFSSIIYDFIDEIVCSA